MKKQIKYIILLIVSLFLLSGCVVNSDITVNYDGSVNEKISIMNNNEVFVTKSNAKDVYNKNIKEYKKVLDFKKYTYSFERNNSMSGGVFNKKYDNLCQYFENSAFNQYVYKYMNCTETDEYYEIKNATEYIPYCPECSDWPALDNVELTIKLPVNAIEQNADEIDNTTYKWKYGKGVEDKNFYLKVSKADLKEYKVNYEETLKNHNKIKNIAIISIVVILLVSSVTFIYIKFKKNKLDY